MKEFVDGWDIIQALGEGAYGEVLLVKNRQTREAVAAKAIEMNDPSKKKELMSAIRKEVFVHRLLNHPNIIRFYGHRAEPNVHFIFLQYASGGELFDRIEPDFGMPQSEAHKYFSQIISGVEYLHTIGVAHRDLKPENVLLDEHDNVKISDFGLATLFRHKGTERLLNKRCGTLPYVSPEVFSRVYRAEPADIWSCGIMLVAMLAGELPWDKPTLECKDFVNWKQCKFSLSPWSKLDNFALALLKKVLAIDPESRCKISEIKNSLWFRKVHRFKDVAKWDAGNVKYKRQCSDLNTSVGSIKNDENLISSWSQPSDKFNTNGMFDLNSESIDVLMNGVSFSQPANTDSLMTICSQFSSTQPDMSQSPLERMAVKRMTRFFVKLDAESAAEELRNVLDSMGYTWKKFAAGQVVINTVDKRKTTLIFKATLVEICNKILFEFRLSKGDGLEFKRHFLAIRNAMTHLIVQAPVTWPSKHSSVNKLS